MNTHEPQNTMVHKLTLMNLETQWYINEHSQTSRQNGTYMNTHETQDTNDTLINTHGAQDTMVHKCSVVAPSYIIHVFPLTGHSQSLF